MMKKETLKLICLNLKEEKQKNTDFINESTLHTLYINIFHKNPRTLTNEYLFKEQYVKKSKIHCYININLIGFFVDFEAKQGQL